MARNKYPEVTVEKILEVSKKLFLEKGYENTTIPDIVKQLGGLTKGAVYHHFKSKEDILNALGDKMFFDNNPFEKVRNRKDLNGLQKLKQVILLHQSDEEQVEITMQVIPLLKNPRILVGMIESNHRILSPLWLELLEEGNRDGSIHTEYAKELSELLPLLDLWMQPTVFPASAGEMYRKYEFMKTLFEEMGVPLFDDDIMEAIQKYFPEEIEK